MKSPATNPAVNPLVYILVYACALWPQGLWLYKRTMEPTDPPLALLALVSVSLLAWQIRGQLRSRPRAGLLLLSLTVVTSFVLPPLLTTLLALIAIAVATGIARKPGLLGLLLLGLPIMASVNFYFGWPLRLGISTCSELLLNLIGCSVTREGTLLLYQNAEVGVDPPCSGIRMLWFTGYLTCALAALHQLSWPRFLLLIPYAFFLSLAANILRATILFFPESGIVSWPYWSHLATGVALHLIVALLLHRFVTHSNTKTICSHPHPSSFSEPA